MKVAVVSTFEHRSFELADVPILFKPQTDIVILIAIANHIVQMKRVNREFVTNSSEGQRRREHRRLDEEDGQSCRFRFLLSQLSQLRINRPLKGCVQKILVHLLSRCQ